MRRMTTTEQYSLQAIEHSNLLQQTTTNDGSFNQQIAHCRKSEYCACDADLQNTIIQYELPTVPCPGTRPAYGISPPQLGRWFGALQKWIWLLPTYLTVMSMRHWQLPARETTLAFWDSRVKSRLDSFVRPPSQLDPHINVNIVRISKLTLLSCCCFLSSASILGFETQRLTQDVGRSRAISNLGGRPEVSFLTPPSSAVWVSGDNTDKLSCSAPSSPTPRPHRTNSPFLYSSVFRSSLWPRVQPAVVALSVTESFSATARIMSSVCWRPVCPCDRQFLIIAENLTIF